MLEQLASFVEKHYKMFLALNIVLILSFAGFIGYKAFVEGEVFKKDISLTGGVLVTVPYNFSTEISPIVLSNQITQYTGIPSDVRIIYDSLSGKPIFLQIESENITEQQVISFFKNEYNITFSSDSVQVQEFDPYFGESVWNEYVKLVEIVIVLIGIMIYLRFRNVVGTTAVISTILFDLLGTIAIISAIKYPISTVAFVAFLMIVGYAIDNNIVMATNYTKEKDLPFTKRMAMALFTGILMDLTTLIVLFLMYLLIESSIIREISLILGIALTLDLYYLIFGNIAIYKYFDEKRQTSTTQEANQ